MHRYEAGALAESQTFAPNGILLTKTTYTKFPDKNLTQEVRGETILSTWRNTLGLPIRIQQGDKVTFYTYDPCGNCIATIDGEGRLTSHKFNASGRLTQKILPDGAEIHYDYDRDSNLISCHMPGGLFWKAVYDAMGRKTAEWQEAEGKPFQSWKYVYEKSLLTQVSDPLGRLHHYAYDSHLRLVKENVGKYTRSYSSDPRNLLCSASEIGKENTKVERSYDASGRLIQEQISLNGKAVQNSKQSWTPSTRSLQIGDHQREFHYQNGQLKYLSTSAMELSYDYDVDGSLIRKKTSYTETTIAYRDGLPKAVHARLLENFNEESLEWTSNSKLASYHSTYPGSEALTYSYTAKGYLQAVNDERFIFDFDQPGRGIRTASPNSEVPNDGLDRYGRIIKDIIEQKRCETTYDPMGQVIVHDKDQFIWDPWGRLVAVSNDTFEWTASYDALGRRLQTTYAPINNYYFFKAKGKSIVTHSFFDPEQEFQEIGIVSGDVTFWKLYGANGCDAVLDDHGNGLVLHHDMKSNLKAVLASQESHWNENYPTPYGPNSIPEPGLSDLLSYAQSLTWQSQKLDPTGLIWLGARYYDPQGGRFFSPDPIGYPLCLDLYAYANGDPINNFDPDGRFFSPVYDTLKTASNNFSQGYSNSISLTNNEISGKNSWTTNNSLSYGMGESYGRMEGSFRRVVEAISPQRPEGLSIGELPLPGNVGNLLKVGSNAVSILGEGQLVKKEFELNRFHQAARNLSEEGQNNIRILRGWAKSKGWSKAPNSGGPEKWGTFKNGEFEWNIAIKPEASMRPGLHVDSNLPRFDARLNINGNYINPFTGEMGNKTIGTHLPLDKSYY